MTNGEGHRPGPEVDHIGVPGEANGGNDGSRSRGGNRHRFGAQQYLGWAIRDRSGRDGAERRAGRSVGDRGG